MIRLRIPGGAVLAAALILFLAPLPLAAQDRTGTVEITPVFGGHFGGRIYSGGSSAFSDDVGVKNAATFGLRAAYNANEWLAVEAGFSTARSDIQSVHESPLYGKGVKLGRLDEQHYELNAIFNLGHGRVVPYLTLGGGVTRFDVKANGAPDDTQTRLAANVGAGVKASIAPHLGLKLEWRSRAERGKTQSCDSASPYCDPSTSRYDDRWYYRWYTNTELTGGVSYTF